MNNLSKKNIIIIAISAVVVATIIIVAIIFATSGKKEKKESLQETLNKLGSSFYENYYYAGMEDKQILANYTDSGVNIDMNSLNVLVPIDEHTKSLLDKNKCDYQNTKLVFYPNSPYGSTDYTIKVELACEK